MLVVAALFLLNILLPTAVLRDPVAPVDEQKNVAPWILTGCETFTNCTLYGGPEVAPIEVVSFSTSLQTPEGVEVTWWLVQDRKAIPIFRILMAPGGGVTYLEVP